MSKDEKADTIAEAAADWAYAGGTVEALEEEALRRFPGATDDWKRGFFGAIARHTLAKKAPEGIHYYDPVRNWRKIKRHLDDRDLNDILVRDFNKYTFGRTRRRFSHGQFPSQFEGALWDFGRKGRRPMYWRYVKYAACHWLVNFNLKLATLVEPRREWRILTSNRHSTVWDGRDTLFDCNFLALGISPEECFLRANITELAPWKQLRVYFPVHYSGDPAKDTWAALRADMTAEEIEALAAEDLAWRKTRGKIKSAAPSSQSNRRVKRAKQRECHSRRQGQRTNDHDVAQAAQVHGAPMS